MKKQQMSSLWNSKWRMLYVVVDTLLTTSLTFLVGGGVAFLISKYGQPPEIHQIDLTVFYSAIDLYHASRMQLIVEIMLFSIFASMYFFTALRIKKFVVIDGVYNLVRFLGRKN